MSLEKTKKVSYWLLCNWVELIAAIALVLACTITFINVIVRYFFTSFVIVGGEELTTLFIIWTVFMGAAVGYKHKMLFGIDVFVNLLPQLAKDILAWFGKIIILITSILLIYYGWIFAKNGWIRTTSNLGIPYFFLDIPVCICFAIIAYYTIKDILLIFWHKFSKRQAEVKIKEGGTKV